MKNSLVSIQVVTYNSAQTIIETLDSIKAQTYPNIELIISDDCSMDNTVEICRKWIDENNKRFARTDILTVMKNTGVSANCNRVDDASQGEWAKIIAGDDLLMPNCVQDCMEYVAEHPETIYLFGRCKAFGVEEERCKEIENNFDYSFFSLTQKEQLHYLLTESNCIPATTAFYNRERALALGVQNDERIPNLEDWPKWINLLKAGVHFNFVDKVTVKYRVSESSLSTSRVRSEKFKISNALFYKYYQFPYEYEYGNKKQAIENWLRVQNTIHKNKCWYIIFKMYKILIMHKLH